MKEKPIKISFISEEQRRKAVEEKTREAAKETVAQLPPKEKRGVLLSIRSNTVNVGPNNAEELWNYIRIVYGFTVPLYACSEDTVAPFEWVYDLYFDKHPQTFVIGSRGGGKCLALDTPIHTADTLALTTIGNLREGDHVFDERGYPTKVVKKHEVIFGNPCFEIVFTDGIDSEVIVADAEHLWPVYNEHGGYDLVTTEFMFHNQTAKFNMWETDWYVLTVENHKSVPVQCIEVDNPTHLFQVGLIGITTHNTYPASFITDMKCRLRPGYEAIHAGAIKTQAEVAQKYLLKFSQDPVLNPSFRGRPSATRAVWKNGSMWSIVTGSMGGVSGQHPRQLTLDEIEFWEVEALEQSYATPSPSEEYPAQHHCFSTSQRSFGAANYLRGAIENGEKDVKLYRWNCFETMQRCQTCECIKGGRVVSEPMSVCGLWDVCKGLKGTKSSGWIPRKEVERMRKTLSREAFETQFLCSRPSSHGLVLFNFEHKLSLPNDVHAGNLCRWGYTPDLPLFCAHDPAEGQKSVLFFFQIYAGKVFLFDEIIIDNCFSVSVVKKKLYEHCVDKGYNLDPLIIVDPHRKDAGEDWRAGVASGLGIGKSYRVDYPDMTTGYAKIEPGLELVRTLIANGAYERKFFVDVRCKGVLNAIKEHHYKVTKTNEIIGAKEPDKPFKDEIDTIRYFLIWAAMQSGEMRIGGTFTTL